MLQKPSLSKLPSLSFALISPMTGGERENKLAVLSGTMCLSIEFLKNNKGYYQSRQLTGAAEGVGWTGKEFGLWVGRAKTVMDHISIQAAAEHDIVVSLDADTRFNPGYLSSIIG
ncbi:MAG: hypothetical protein MZU84_01095 [Sphingobacterium sp.]|nr:hypothetical protein [Sphingobacterium sp.]